MWFGRRKGREAEEVLRKEQKGWRRRWWNGGNLGEGERNDGRRLLPSWEGGEKEKEKRKDEDGGLQEEGEKEGGGGGRRKRAGCGRWSRPTFPSLPR